MIITLSILLIIAISAIICLIISKSNTEKELTGTVIVADSKYVLVESEGEDYLVDDITGTYEIGNKVKFKYREKNLDEDSNPKRIKIYEEILIEESPTDEPVIEDIPPQNPTPKPDTGHTVVTPPNTVTKNADDEVLTYFDELDRSFQASSIKDSLKSGFITVVDFLFYNGTIKGHTFKDLSDSAKLKVLSMALYFDEKIETYFPGYKESISSTTNKIYTNAKNEILTTYLNVAAKVCENNEDLCTSAKEGFETLKKNFGLTWALIKDIAGDGLDSLKNWYEIFSGK